MPEPCEIKKANPNHHAVPIQRWLNLRSLAWLSLPLVGCVLLGLYCCELNRQLYEHKNPFFDSLSYYESLFRVMTISGTDGFPSGMKEGCFNYTTVCLPFIFAATVGEWVEPTRFVGIWIQVSYLVLFQISLFYYLTQIKKLRLPTAALGSLTFLATACLFFSNGGLSDFRMDIGLCLTFGITICWYLVAIAKPNLTHFVLFGIAAAFCCLSRATAPIYLVVSLAPLALIELIHADNRKKKLIGLTVATLTTIALAGWFFILNFDYLYYYYAVWNTDANAKIPWNEALLHLKLTQRCLGNPLIYFIVILQAGVGITAIVHHQLRAVTKAAWKAGDIDLRIAWIGISPVALMIARRAGLNPFVCMPAVIGLLLLFLIPILKNQDRLNDTRLTIFAWICLTFCLVTASFRGWEQHQETSFNSMAAQQQIIDHIITDSAEQNFAQVNYAVMHTTDINTKSLKSILLFDREDATANLNSVTLNQTQLIDQPIFSKYAAADWAAIPGLTDSEKLNHLFQLTNKRLNYLVLPDLPSCITIEKTVPQNYINRHLQSLRSKIETGNWKLIAGPIQTNETEAAEIWRRIPPDASPSKLPDNRD
ncbi:hypothetical protein OAU93_01990 [bacterium]|nr:hypothetical protein [bacterium]